MSLEKDIWNLAVGMNEIQSRMLRQGIPQVELKEAEDCHKEHMKHEAEIERQDDI